MAPTYFPQYVHSNLEDGKIQLRICVASDTDREDNYEVLTEFCKSWNYDPDENYTFINVDFDIKHIIDDALYADREERRKYKFDDHDDMQFLLQLQSELMQGLSSVTQAIIECHEATA